MTAEFTPPTGYGTAFKNGKLYELDRTSIRVLRGWPEMRAWQRTAFVGRPRVVASPA